MGSWCLSHLTSCSSERFLWSLPASYSLAPAEEAAQGSLGMGDLRLSLILSPSWRESTFWGSPSCPCPQFKKVISSVFFRIRPQLALPTFYSPPPKKKKVKCSFHLVPSSVTHRTLDLFTNATYTHAVPIVNLAFFWVLRICYKQCSYSHRVCMHMRERCNSQVNR